MDAFTSIFTNKFMIWLISRVRHYLTFTLRSPVDKRGFFYLNYNFFKNFLPFNWTSICYCMEASIHRNLPFLLKSILTCVLFFVCYEITILSLSKCTNYSRNHIVKSIHHTSNTKKYSY
ncbi:hypothetical protein FYW06_14395 [Bacillus paranthracis]|uniref:Uncharacterized protein n=1 Tax=Bacillus paranthracis TaxID=2026186 RepID=A0A5M9GYM7_9BACI|nr:hypothetical protein FYW06_14395 [Bacillus paranthracis]PCC79396.1 hypothetical protein CNQ76_11135 [Bacillus cereus]MBE7108416.1 hypothetical protein [Bacillus paranthracis]MBR9738624.1 hypothetical protein [Bacillus paranthracis]MDR4165299.1 hypothetical protein [Bacillus paranthracis]